jgi:hypothetical protein
MNQITVADFHNVLILARRAIALQGAQMPAEEGEAAFRSIKMLEVFTNNLVEQQKQEQARIDQAVADAEKSLESVKQNVSFVELNDETK